MTTEPRGASVVTDRSIQAKTDLRAAKGPRLMSAGTLTGDEVCNKQEETLGKIKEIMLDLRNGRIGYAVVSSGSFLGIGEKLFAVPWKALELDAKHKRFVMNVEKDFLDNAPVFDKDNWPDMENQEWSIEVHDYYGVKQYSDDRVPM